MACTCPLPVLEVMFQVPAPSIVFQTWPLASPA